MGLDNPSWEQPYTERISRMENNPIDVIAIFIIKTSSYQGFVVFQVLDDVAEMLANYVSYVILYRRVFLYGVFGVLC